MSDIWQDSGFDAVFVPPAEGGAAIIGEMTWVEALSPNSAGAAKFVTVGDSSYSPFGHCSASRTSTGGGIADIAISLQDNPAPGGGAWGRYTEAWVYSYAHANNTQFGHEYAAINQRATVGISTPNAEAQPGIINVLRLGVGKPTANSKNITSFISCINAEGDANPNAVARIGMLIARGALKMINGIGEAFALAKDYGVFWYDSFGSRAASIMSSVDNAAYSSHVVFTNGAIHFLDAQRVAQFSFNTITGVAYYGSQARNPAPVTGQVAGKMLVYIGGQPFYVPLYFG